MSGTKKKIKKTKSSTKSASKKLLQSSVIQKPISQKTGIKSTKADKPSSDIHTKTDKSLSSSLKKKKTKTLGSSQRENSKKQIKNPWDGYDYDNKTSINIAEGNLVREGNVIQFYDSVSDNFHMAKIIFIQSASIGTEIELFDLDEKKTRVFIMNN